MDHRIQHRTPQRLQIRHHFENQRSNANRRGIPFLLTYAEWLRWWLDSGHAEHRGRNKGQYVMARIGDVGSYALNNIICITNSENISVANTGRNTGRKMTAEHRANMITGKRRSAEQRLVVYQAELARKRAKAERPTSKPRYKATITEIPVDRHHHGDLRNDGFRFYGYKNNRNGTFSEIWLSPKAWYKHIDDNRMRSRKYVSKTQSSVQQGLLGLMS
jgi:hypothetical protein